MSMLKRYRRTKDGFVTLLALVENSTTQKRERLLKMIGEEDPKVVDVLRRKILTIDRVLTWDAMIISEITSRLPDSVLAGLIYKKSPDVVAKISKTISHQKMRLISSLSESLSLNPMEIESIHIMIFEKVRELDKDGVISLRRIDPDLDIKDEKVA